MLADEVANRMSLFYANALPCTKLAMDTIKNQAFADTAAITYHQYCDTSNATSLKCLAVTIAFDDIAGNVFNMPFV